MKSCDWERLRKNVVPSGAGRIRKFSSEVEMSQQQRSRVSSTNNKTNSTEHVLMTRLTFSAFEIKFTEFIITRSTTVHNAPSGKLLTFTLDPRSVSLNSLCFSKIWFELRIVASALHLDVLFIASNC